MPFDVAVVAASPFRDRYRRFLEAATARDLPICSLAGAFDGHRFERLTINAMDAHPNAAANRLAAEFVLPCLMDGLASNNAYGP